MMALFTIGYAGHTPSTLVAVLREAGVRRVVDVRAFASSRKPGFSRRALGASLAEAGIGYEHLRELGNPFRNLYRSGRPADGEERYREYVRTQPALDELAARL